MPDNTSIWDDDPEYSPLDWKYEVANGDTRLGYWAWVDHQKELDADETAD